MSFWRPYCAVGVHNVLMGSILGCWGPYCAVGVHIVLLASLLMLVLLLASLYCYWHPCSYGSPSAGDAVMFLLSLLASLHAVVVHCFCKHPCFWWGPYCVGGPVVAFIPAVACFSAVVSDHDIAVILNVVCCWRYCCCLCHCCCLHPDSGMHSCCCWRSLSS